MKLNSPSSARTKAFISLLFLVVINRPVRPQGEAITLSVMGDIPYGTSEIPLFLQQIAEHNLYSPSEFLVHLGDIKSASEPCDEERYIFVANTLKTLGVPAFIVPGDNEWVDCSDPGQGWSYWEAHLMGIDTFFCGTEDVEHQAVRPENFAFVRKGVLFIGLNLVSGTTPDPNEWNLLIQQDVDWIAQKFQEDGSKVRAVVVMSQAGPGSSKRKPVFDQLEASASALGKPVLLIHGDGHVWIQDNPFSYSNMMRVQVEDGGDEDPVQLTVTMNTQNVNTAFVFLRNPWNNNPPLYNVPPCVKAGDDQSVTVLNNISLQGRASDDGVPLSPGSLTLTWSKVSGPGAATFGNIHADTTTVSFSVLGTYVLRLTASDGQMASEDELTINVNDGGPIISDFTPPSGPVGTEVTITGDNFLLANHVAFNGILAGSFIIDSHSQIRAAVPPGATSGPISVGNPIDTVQSVDNFYVTLPPQTLTFNPVEDSRVSSDNPNSNYGSSNSLRVGNASNALRSYLKFNISGLNSPVEQATLRLYCTNASNNGGSIYVVSNSWTESTITWNNAPPIEGTLIANVGPVAINTWIEIDVTSAISGNGSISLGIKSNSTNDAYYHSKEGSDIPELIVQTASPSITPLIVNVKAFLQGPYHGGAMATTVKDNGGLPLAQPYNISPWNYSGGENVNNIAADVADWVLLALRSSAAGGDLAYRAAFIKADGSIVDTSGSGGVSFAEIPYGNYFVVIYHRNHLAIMSSTALALADNSALYDFTAMLNRAYGSNPMKEVETGIFAMIAGDGNSDGMVNNNDKTIWRSENGAAWSYSKPGDFNLDGGVDVLDLNYCWRANNGSQSGVPGVSASAGILR